MQKAVLTLVFAACLAALAPTSVAEACSCMRQSPEEAAAAADAIFEARILEVNPPPAGDQSSPIRVRVRVSTQWKGIESEELVLHTAPNSARCGYNFEQDQVYLIYAQLDEETGTPLVSLCSRTQLADQADEDRAHLGPGTTPVDPTVEDPGAPELDDDVDDAVEAAQPPETATPAESDPGASTNGHASSGGCASCRVGASRGGALPLLLGLGLFFGLGRSRRRR